MLDGYAARILSELNPLVGESALRRVTMYVVDYTNGRSRLNPLVGESALRRAEVTCQSLFYSLLSPQSPRRGIGSPESSERAVHGWVQRPVSIPSSGNRLSGE